MFFRKDGAMTAIEKLAGSEEEYGRIVFASMGMAERDLLPFKLYSDYTETITAKDITQFTKRFKHDTGLNCQITLNYCEECQCVHMMLEVYSEFTFADVGQEVLEYDEDEDEEEWDGYLDEPLQ